MRISKEKTIKIILEINNNEAKAILSGLRQSLSIAEPCFPEVSELIGKLERMIEEE